MKTEYSLTTDYSQVDWDALKADLLADDFDNGRTADELRRCAENSYINIYAKVGGRVIGTARVLSDGVCNALIVDVWTHSQFRRQGIGTAMITALMNGLAGQHVTLFTEDAAEFYERLGFETFGEALAAVSGNWLNRPV